MPFTPQINETFLMELTTTSNLTTSDEESVLVDSIFMPIVAILSILGFGGNAIVILCVIKESKLRTIANYVIAHFAFVNLTYCTLILSSQTSMYREYTAFACVTMSVVGILFFMLSLHSQLVISFNRYMLVTKSADVYNMWFTVKKTGVLLASFWLLDTILYLLVPGILVNWTITYLPEHSICMFASADYHYGRAMSPLTWSSFILALGFYLAMIIYVRKNSMTNGHKRRDIKASLILFVVMILYLLTYNILPNVISYFNEHTSSSYLTRKWINGVIEILQWLNLSVGPLFYSLKVKEFRMTQRKLVCPFKTVHPSVVHIA